MIITDFTVTVTCTEPSHDPWVVAEYSQVRVTPSLAGLWVMSAFMDKEGRLVRPSGALSVVLYDGEDGVEAVDRVVARDAPGVIQTQLRVREQLRCRICRYGFPVRKENLIPVLETLRLNGILSVSLRALGARIGSSRTGSGRSSSQQRANSHARRNT